jgi:DNA-binding CsgD family transcriptional regulator
MSCYFALIDEMRKISSKPKEEQYPVDIEVFASSASDADVPDDAERAFEDAVSEVGDFPLQKLFELNYEAALKVGLSQKKAVVYGHLATNDDFQDASKAAGYKGPNQIIAAINSLCEALDLAIYPYKEYSAERDSEINRRIASIVKAVRSGKCLQKPKCRNSNCQQTASIRGFCEFHYHQNRHDEKKEKKAQSIKTVESMESQGRAAGLSRREAKVYAHLHEKKTCSEVAAVLNVKTTTVLRDVSAICKKMEIQKRALPKTATRVEIGAELCRGFLAASERIRLHAFVSANLEKFSCFNSTDGLFDSELLRIQNPTTHLLKGGTEDV